MLPRCGWSVGVLCLAGFTIRAAPLAACDPAWLPMGRAEGISVFVAVGLRDTLLDGGMAVGGARLHPGFGTRMDGVIGETRGGQRVRLLYWNDAVRAGAREAVLVPWDYGPDCRPIAWQGRLRWMPEGRRGAITGWLRPKAGWIGGLPTFDVEMAWREPVWAEGEPRWSDAMGNARRMTPEEFAELYSALPTYDLLKRSPKVAAERMRAWEREHPELAKLVPAATMAGYVYRYAASAAAREGT